MFFGAKQLFDYAKTPNGRNWVGSLYALSGGEARTRYNHLTHQYDYPPLTQGTVRRALKRVRTAILARETYICGQYISKWLRPWDVVPALANWQAPAGDYGVGVEVEMGFRGIESARIVADHIKDWRYVAIDFEGGDNPIEATFPPMVYSRINKRSQVMRYLDYLKANSGLVYSHANYSSVGTHINVSRGGGLVFDEHRVIILRCEMQRMFDDGRTTGSKYFGRRPYGYCFSHMDGKYVEFKLFNSQLDRKRLLQYIDISVALAELLGDRSLSINTSTVTAALEKGYNKRAKPVSNVRKKKGVRISGVEQVQTELAFAA